MNDIDYSKLRSLTAREIVKAIAWSWDEDVFAYADSALKSTISDKTGKTISRVDIDWQGFQPNMFHGLLK
jgi:hypothetical protein